MYDFLEDARCQKVKVNTWTDAILGENRTFNN